MTIEIYRLLDINSEEKEIEFFCDYEIQNDGIGSYEFWGSKEFDKGIDYVVLEEVTWDKNLYSERENNIIKDWVTENWKSIKKEIEQKNKELKS